MAGRRRGRLSWPTSFALQPDLQFKFFLCVELGKMPEEIDQMSCVDYQRFSLYYQRKNEAEKKAIDDAKRRQKRGRR